MSDIFISYARSPASQARAIAEALRGLGYRVWLDDELPAHRSYSDVIKAPEGGQGGGGDLVAGGGQVALGARRGEFGAGSRDAGANQYRRCRATVALKSDPTRGPRRLDR
ncbi:MAG TPA: TIR domain-containing protein [Caulobacteraceae bacterium]